MSRNKRPLEAREVKRALKALGFSLRSQRGSHDVIALKFDKARQGIIFKVTAGNELYAVGVSNEDEELVEHFNSVDSVFSFCKRVKDDPSEGLIW